ncbi:Type I restriction-modification enzyme subunit S [Xenorhabdus nematophila F1]|uniref:restriction endonuclease subunit S n=1 Tax=Xenorhabdus nematophila TaxID=628 RepID=UPI0003275379|nr:Type I restriction-modification enzyme subunit S [Xenorhabdus nematophila F1]
MTIEQVLDLSKNDMTNKAGTAVPVGYKQTEVGVIPEGWEVLTYGDIFSFLSTSTNPRSDLSGEGEYGYIHYGDIHTLWDHSLDLKKNILPKISANLVSSAFIEDGDIIMADVSEDYEGVGKSIEVSNVGKQKIVAGLHTYLLRDKENVLANGYRGYLHSIPAVKKIINQLATGMKVYGISKNNLLSVPLLVPTKKEQTSIANALSDVDALISELEKLLSKKQSIKTATMQQLLTGRIRLPQFALCENGSKKGYKQSELGEIPEDWEIICIKDVGFVDPENLGSTTSLDYKFDYISLEQIDAGVLLGTVKCTFNTAPLRARRVLQQGDVLISTVRPNLMSHYFVREDVRDLVCSTGFSVVRCLKDKLRPGYLYQHFFSAVINNQIDMLISGSNYPAINSSDVKNLKIQLGSVNEQTAIATILSDMDTEIQALEQKLDKTRQIKQGMMQELLTGKTRLI